MIPNPCIEVKTSSEVRLSVPEWFAEVVIMVHHLTKEGVLDAFVHQVRLQRGRFGSYEPIDFLALLLGYALSGERTLADFFERVTHARDRIYGPLWTPMSSAQVESESLSGGCGSSLLGSIPCALPTKELLSRVDFGKYWWHL